MNRTRFKNQELFIKFLSDWHGINLLPYQVEALNVAETISSRNLVNKLQKREKLTKALREDSTNERQG